MTMQLSYNPGSTAQAVTPAKAEAGMPATPEPISVAGTLSVHQQQPVAVPEVDWSDFTTVFFAAGVVINLVMITVYLVWAYKQWGKAGAGEE